MFIRKIIARCEYQYDIHIIQIFHQHIIHQWCKATATRRDECRGETKSGSNFKLSFPIIKLPAHYIESVIRYLHVLNTRRLPFLLMSSSTKLTKFDISELSLCISLSLNPKIFSSTSLKKPWIKERLWCMARPQTNLCFCQGPSVSYHAKHIRQASNNENL